MMKPELQAKHHWLQKLVGEWTTHGEEPAEAGQSPATDAGTESVRSIGGLWAVCEGHMQVEDATMTSVITLGYDPSKKRFVGTFIASMMTYLWIYDKAEHRTAALCRCLKVPVPAKMAARIAGRKAAPAR